ncbi:hypothetical protein EMPG_15710 [Blastomyces silverae]|uniref:Uncharacterized protein n=1 Tax=Blastomyces silverae TaxID=2060906 RepID=A0A0H1BCM7_9EURO|nr:hypothetical protein EMPG_15710 [Blastomyces silverae]
MQCGRGPNALFHQRLWTVECPPCSDSVYASETIWHNCQSGLDWGLGWNPLCGTVLRDQSSRRNVHRVTPGRACTVQHRRDLY